MLLLDNVFFVFSALYRLSKEEREYDSWKFSGIALTALSLILLALAIIVIIFNGLTTTIANPITFSILAVVIFISVVIRYKKFTTFEKIELRLKKLSETKKMILDILTIIYILVSIPGVFIFIIVR